MLGTLGSHVAGAGAWTSRRIPGRTSSRSGDDPLRDAARGETRLPGGDSAADTMSAILREDPPDLSATNQSVSPHLERIVRHCLEKKPEQLSTPPTTSRSISKLCRRPREPRCRRRRRPRRFRWVPLGAALAAIAIAAAAYFLGRRETDKTSLSFQQLTFRRGFISSARFSPDGETFVLTASWDGSPRRSSPADPVAPSTPPSGSRAQPWRVFRRPASCSS